MERVFALAEATELLPRLTTLLTALRNAHRAALAEGGELRTPPAVVEWFCISGDEGLGPVLRRPAPER